LKEKSAKRLEGEYVRIYMKEKMGDSPPDIPNKPFSGYKLGCIGSQI
jgi:hypothetical protein